jgi:MGT family glycosyltransferase
MLMKFAFVVPPLAGHVNPTLGLGAELIQRGHEVVWISLDETLEKLLPAKGRLLLVREEGGEDHRDKISQKNVYGVESIRFLYDDVLIPLNRHMSAGIGSWVDWFRPDVIINDHQLFAGAVAAWKRGIPYATSVTAPAAVKMMDDLPGVHEWEVQRIVALQQELGIEGDRCIACSEQMALLFTSREFFGEMELPPAYQFVGPVVRRPVAGGSFDWELLRRMEGRPRILISIGTTFDHSQQLDFLRKVVIAFEGEPMSVILVSDESLLEEWPENFLVQRRIPQLELLQHLDAVVCHGGHNTVCETLTHGLPLVVLPIAYDQSHVASRVVAAESGIRLNFKRFKPGDLRAAVWEVLRERKYRDAAGRIGASFREAGGVVRAADLLEGMKGEVRPMTKVEK